MSTSDWFLIIGLILGIIGVLMWLATWSYSVYLDSLKDYTGETEDDDN